MFSAVFPDTDNRTKVTVLGCVVEATDAFVSAVTVSVFVVVTVVTVLQCLGKVDWQ